MKLNKYLKYLSTNYHIIFFVLFFSVLLFKTTFLHEIDDDLVIYFSYATKIFHSQIPFKDFLIEYPPLSTIFFTVPYLLGRNIETYQFFFGLNALLFITFGDLLINKFFGKRPFIIYAILLVLLPSQLIFQRIDIFVAVSLLTSLILFNQEKYKLSVMLLAIGTAIKFFPVLILPFYLIKLKGKNRLSLLFYFIIFLFLILLPFCILNNFDFPKLFYFVEYSFKRPIETGSLWSSANFIIQHFKDTNLHHVSSFASQNIASSISNHLISLSFFSFLIFYIFSLLLFFKKHRLISIFEICFLVLCGFIIFSKVFSPQYLIWIIVLIPCLKYSQPMIFMLAAIIIFSRWIWPENFWSLVNFDQTMIFILFLRNFLFLLLPIYYFFAILKNEEEYDCRKS